MVERWFQPLVDRMLQRLTEMNDVLWQAERDAAEGRWNPDFQAQAARTRMLVWRTGTRLLAAWDALDLALETHGSARKIDHLTMG
jgi:hypothetical protein